MVRPLATLVVAALAACGLPAAAQTTARPTAQSLYQEALALERVLRSDLAAPDAGDALATRLRGVIAAYERVVLRFPTSGYCDNALWQAAGLAREAVQRWSQDRDRAARARLLKWLIAEYPASPFLPRARAELAQVTAAAAAPPAPATKAAPARIPALPAAPAAPAASVAAEASIAELRAIRREVLPDLLRITIELDREVPHATEQLDNPARVFFDFSPSRLSPGVAEGTLTYADDIVRQIRIGTRPERTTRVAIDLDGVKTYSAYEMYNPYRLVVDCERGQPAGAAPAVPLPTGRHVATRPPLAAAAWGPVFQGLSGYVAGNPPPRDAEGPRAPTPARAVPTPAPATLAPPQPPARPVEAPASPDSNLSGGFSLARQLGLGVSRVVIDPGHGGQDPGALGGGAREADVVLDVALRLEKLLLAEPGTEVVLTRRTNVYVALEERTAIANQAQADLFLSIHVNANRSRSVSGIETYFLNFASTPDAAAVAARENAAAGMNMGSLPDIVKTIALSSKANESRDFATMVQQAMVRRLSNLDKGLKDLGVKQAPFVVLIGAAMPSVLVEVSFITNGQESRLLRNEAYRQRIAESLADGIRRYQKTLKTARPTVPQ